MSENMVNQVLTTITQSKSMHRALILALTVLALAGSAHAQKTKAKPPVPLRGNVAATAPTPRSPAPSAPALDALGARSLFLPAPIASAPVGGAPEQCRLVCAQTYYFCLASDGPEQCPSSWSICRSGCDAPTLTTSY